MTPRLTVVMPLYGGRELLADTFDALTEHTPVEHEVIVVDNASPDGAADWIAEHQPNARLRRNTSNLGFGVACNQGALMATAPLVCFLNSDARVQAGWFEALGDAIAAVPEAAASVPRYLEPDGRLQEAGCAIDGRGEGVLLGHRQDASDRRFRFRRVVEYGSAACLLVRREAFDAVGGFDPSFGLAYFEDSDFALRLVASGHRIVYAPDATVVHERNASPRPPGLDALRDRNRALLLSRWPDLAARPVHDDLVLHPERILALRDMVCGDRLMALVDRVPDPDHPIAGALAEIVSSWPAARVTIVSTEPPTTDADTWLELGVEIAEGHADWPAWFRDRIGQATVALTVGADAASHFDPCLRSTQPQAARLHQVEPGVPDDWSVAADAVLGATTSLAAALVALGWPPVSLGAP